MLNDFNLAAMKLRNVFYLVETIHPWVGVDRFALVPNEVTASHKLFKNETEAYEAFHLDCTKWREWGGREFNTFHYQGNREDGLLQMRQFILPIDGKEFVGYTKIIELKAK